jgi:hypothetical protein
VRNFEDAVAFAAGGAPGDILRHLLDSWYSGEEANVGTAADIRRNQLILNHYQTGAQFTTSGLSDKACSLRSRSRLEKKRSLP